MMDTETITQLVQKFLDGETTIAEERLLCHYFTSVSTVPESLQPYAELFRDLATLPSAPKTVHRHLAPRLRWAVAAIAASVALALMVVLGYRSHQYSQLSRLYEGSYMVVSGHRIDNLRLIKDSIASTLADAKRIENSVEHHNAIDRAEREIIESADPEQRKEIEKLLN